MSWKNFFKLMGGILTLLLIVGSIVAADGRYTKKEEALKSFQTLSDSQKRSNKAFREFVLEQRYEKRQERKWRTMDRAKEQDRSLNAEEKRTLRQLDLEMKNIERELFKESTGEVR